MINPDVTSRLINSMNASNVENRFFSSCAYELYLRYDPSLFHMVFECSQLNSAARTLNV